MKLGQMSLVGLLLALLLAVGATGGGIKWTGGTVTLNQPGLGVLAENDSVSPGNFVLDWDGYDLAWFEVAVDKDSLEWAGWQLDLSQNGTDYLVITEYISPTLTHTSYNSETGSDGKWNAHQDTTVTLHLARPGIFPGPISMSINTAAGGDSTYGSGYGGTIGFDHSEAQELLFAEYLRFNWYANSGVDASDSCTITVNYRLGKMD